MVAALKRKREVSLLLIIILLAAFFRLYRIGSYAIFLGDEGRDALVVKRMIVDQRWTLLGPSTSVGDLYLGPAYYYLMLIPLWLTNLNPVGPAIMVALFGISTVFLLFKLGQEFFNSDTGLLAAALYSVSQAIIDHTRFSWNPNPMPFFSALAIYSLLRLKKTQKPLWFVILGVSLGISVQLHYMGLVLILATLVILALLRPQIKKRWYFLGLAAFLLVISPIIAFEFRHHFVISKSLRRFLTEDNKLGFSFGAFFSQAGFGYWRLFYHFLAVDNRILAAILVFLASFLLLFAKSKKETLGRRIIFFWLVIGVLGVSFYTGEVHDHYLGFLFPIPFLLVALFVKKLLKARTKVIGSLFFLFLFVVNFLRLDPIRGWRPHNQIKRAELVGKSIAEDAQKEAGSFNIALISPTMDFRAMNYRYFAEINGARAEGFENYTNIDTLYIINEQEEIPLSDVTAWEISSFGEAEEIAAWRFEESGYKVTKLKKKKEK
jgi:4-amino-4-deoxy-L-arabinose transferase-like glycosyltransferase